MVKSKMAKKISCLTSAIILSLSLFSVPAFAVGVDDTSSSDKVRTIINGSVDISKVSSEDGTDSSSILSAENSEMLGSITIQLEDTSKKAPKGNVKFGVVKVADVVDGEFVLTDEFKGLKVDLNKISNSNELDMVSAKFAKYYENLLGINTGATSKETSKESSEETKEYEEETKKATSSKDVSFKWGTVVTTDKSGLAEVKDLEVGVYLLNVLDSASYESVEPFMVSIPVYSETENGMLYDIVVYPKHSPTPVKPDKDKKAPGTGVENNFSKYAIISLALLSSAGVIWLAFRDKKKEVR